MARWEPGTAQRLQQAALDLFVRQGFEQTTAADIAQSVGLTERTFFRHFPDKREVLFDGQDDFVARFVAGVRDAPAGSGPLDLVGAALQAGSAMFTPALRERARLRQAVIEANPPLQERERLKLAGLADVVAGALREHGVDGLSAELAAEAGAGAFRVAFSLWIAAGQTRTMPDILTGVLAHLRGLVATGGLPVGVVNPPASDATADTAGDTAPANGAARL